MTSVSFAFYLFYLYRSIDRLIDISIYLSIYLSISLSFCGNFVVGCLLPPCTMHHAPVCTLVLRRYFPSFVLTPLSRSFASTFGAHAALVALPRVCANVGVADFHAFGFHDPADCGPAGLRHRGRVAVLRRWREKEPQPARSESAIAHRRGVGHLSAPLPRRALRRREGTAQGVPLVRA